MRIQFDVSDEFYARLKVHILDDKYRHAVAAKALDNWLRQEENRRAAQDRKKALKAEALHE